MGFLKIPKEWLLKTTLLHYISNEKDTVASTASVATLAIFYVFRPPSRKLKNACWDIPNPYKKNGGVCHGESEAANRSALPGNGRRKKTH